MSALGWTSTSRTSRPICSCSWLTLVAGRSLDGMNHSHCSSSSSISWKQHSMNSSSHSSSSTCTQVQKNTAYPLVSESPRCHSCPEVESPNAFFWHVFLSRVSADTKSWSKTSVTHEEMKTDPGFPQSVTVALGSSELFLIRSD